MINEREITVEGLLFKVQLHMCFMLVIVEIDNITIMVKHSFEPEVMLPERFDIFNGPKPQEIAKKEYKWLKPLLATSSQLK